MELFVKLARIADILDEQGHIALATSVDSLIKEAIELREHLVKDRFWNKVKKGPEPSSCHLWNGAKDSSGYGIVTIDGKNHAAHRLSYEWANGRKIPKGYVLLHNCDTANCVNDKHLSLGTQDENVKDRVSKNRSARGKNNGRARLSDKNIKKIKKLRAKGWTEKAIAMLFGVGRSTISNILHGRTWGWSETK